MDINFDKIINDLKALFKKPSSPAVLKQTPLKMPQNSNKPLTFQNPIKDNFYNSGGFDPTGKGSVGHVHQGIDLRAPGGTPIYPLAPGVVTAAKTDPKGGNTVNIKYDNGYSTYYAHMGTISVKVNDRVDYNTIVGTVGDSGNAKGFPHLHMQCYKDGGLIDPETILSLPKYTAYNSKKEKLWIDDNSKQVAKNFKIAQLHRAIKLYKIAALLK